MMMMEFSLIAETVAFCTAKQCVATFGSSLLLLNRWDSLVDQSPSGIVQASSSSAVIFPVDAIAPPPVRSSSHKTIRRIRRKRRAKQRVSFGGGDSEDGGGDFDRFLSEGGGNDGPFGFGGGKGWNYGGGGGGGNWDESSSSSSSGSWSDPAMEFVYEVICWIALSNCVHFAFKRIVRIVTTTDGGREKLNLTLSSVC